MFVVTTELTSALSLLLCLCVTFGFIDLNEFLYYVASAMYIGDDFLGFHFHLTDGGLYVPQNAYNTHADRRGKDANEYHNDRGYKKENIVLNN